MSNDDPKPTSNPDGDATWNPAFRPNTETSDVNTPQALKSSQDLEQPDVPNEVKPVQEEPNVEPIEEPTAEDLDESAAWGDDMEAGDDFFTNQESSDVVAEPNNGVQMEQSADEVATVDTSRPKTPPDPSDFPVSSIENVVNPEPESSVNEDHPPNESYEFQGESTELDSAVQEDETVPLSAATPGDDWGDTGDSFDLGQADGQDDGKAIEPTTESGQDHAPTQDIDWGDDNGEFSIDSAFAEAGKGQETANGTSNHATTEDLDAAWQAALGEDDLLDDAGPVFDDDDGFLEDEPDVPAQPVQEIKPTNKYAPPTTEQPPTAPSNPYAPTAPQFTDLSQRPQIQQSQTSPYGNFGIQGYGQQQQPKRPLLKGDAQSFADKSRGGYSSPYDLPDDIAPRKRPSMPVMNRAQAQPTPPRSSSVLNPNVPHGPPSTGPTSTGPPGPPAPSGPPGRSGPPPSAMSPPGSSQSNQPSSFQRPGSSSSTASRKPSGGEGFFADLPMTTKPRQMSSSSQSSRYAPQSSVVQPPPGPQRQKTAPATSPSQGQSQHPLANELRPAQPTVPYADKPSPAPSNNLAPAPPQNKYSPAGPAPASSGRYSPAPPSLPPAASRYSPAPTQSGPTKPTQPFAPRTSSPLAYASPPKEQQTSQPPQPPPQALPPQASAESMEPQGSQPVQGIPSQVSPVKSSTPPPPRAGPPSATSSPRKRAQVNYTPQYQPPSQPTDSLVVSPTRPRTQSPGSTMKEQPNPEDRPRSASGLVSPPPFANKAPVNDSMPIMRHRRQFSKDLTFIAPQDGREVDPLERWKGHAIFNWGLGGSVLTSFPSRTPRYGAGQAIPMIKCGPGNLKIQSAREVCPLPETVSKFPGPLRSKNKKKEVLSWLKSSIDSLEHQFRSSVGNHTLAANEQKRAEERLMLWKVLSLFIENDGVLEGNPTIEEAVRKTLSPESHELPDLTSPYTTGANPNGISQQFPDPARSEPIDPKSFDEIRDHLEKGEREKAVWHAADNRLWAHAMLISSTLNREIWKQVVQEFVRREIKNVSSGNEPMAVLYEIFAGNWEESIDQLVPVSARAGFQMVSKSDGMGSSRNALEGLEKWRLTLLLILGNRSEGDIHALLSLGKLLAGYGRAEAAHICFMFARSVTYFGGVDDPNSNVVLMGADHVHNAQSLGQDLEPIILTELYEYGLSLGPNSATSVLPHLQAYKLQHALVLAEYGYRTEAQSYCDAIANCIKSSTRSSAYYHAHFITQLEDLTKRLSQSPKDSSSAWFSKPSVDKMSSNVWSKFSAFVAGDESDAASERSGAGGEVGPFSRIAGDTPGISPSPSHTDLYGPYGSAGTTGTTGAGAAGASSIPPNPMSNSRYAPTPSYSPHAPQESFSRTRNDLGRPSLDSSDGMYGSRRSSDNYRPVEVSQMTTARSSSYTPAYSSPGQNASPYVPSPNAGMAESQPTYGSGPYQPTPPSSVPIGGSTNHQSAYEPPQPGSEPGPTRGPSIELSPPQTSYGQSSNSYQPPIGGGYEPPSTYQPYSADASGEEDAAQQEVTKKRSIMDLDDEDDELEKRAAALKAQQKSQADKQADDAFRKAAEADAARSQTEKKGWFGWFGRKDSNSSPGPIKAKLGEQNSFYYDPELKKWVNKNAKPEDLKPATATPPPPRAAPRSTSGDGPPGLRAPPGVVQASSRSSSMPPPSGPNRIATPPMSGTSIPDGPPLPPTLSSSLPGATGGPPSRPSTSMSNASSIDDLLGAPAARKGAGKKGKKGRGYVDVMAKD